MHSTATLNLYFDFVNKYSNTIKTARKNVIVNNNFPICKPPFVKSNVKFNLSIFYQNVRGLRTKLSVVKP